MSDQSGDFIIFVQTAATNVSFDVHPIERIVGYYRDPGDVDDLTNVGPIMKFEVSFTTPVDITASETTTLESLIPSEGSADSTQILELSKGTANGKLFYNFGNKSVMINGQFFHGNLAQRLTDTYNFTVSPRG